MCSLNASAGTKTRPIRSSRSVLIRGGTFTLEDVRIVYELIKDTSVDKSNFRKKIIKYCEKVEEKKTEKKGYRPSQKYSFKPLKGDVWL